jgi:hypothetical protein
MRMVLDAIRLKQCLACSVVLLSMAGCVAADPVLSRGARIPDGTIKKYIVTLEGRNFVLRSGGKVMRFGFTTTREIEATSPEEAERNAIQFVNDDAELYGAVLNDSSNPPRVFAIHHIEVETFESNGRPNFDYIFYLDRDT